MEGYPWGKIALAKSFCFLIFAVFMNSIRISIYSGDSPEAEKKYAVRKGNILILERLGFQRGTSRASWERRGNSRASDRSLA